MSNTKILRVNGYGSDDSGRLVCYREPEYRFAHEQLAVIQIRAPKDFATKVVAALDEPAALVGIGLNSAVVLFRLDRPYPKAAAHPFIFEGKQGSLIATVQAAPIDVSEFIWRNDRSPLTVARNSLPLLFDDIVEMAVHAVADFGVTLGSLPTAEEIAAETAREERLAKIAADIASGKLNPNPTPEQQLEIDDNALVAAHEGVDFAVYDGNMASLVLAARARVARRKAQAEAARVAALTPEQREAERQAREDAATVERFKDLKLTEADGERAAQIVQARRRHAARQLREAVAA